MIDQRKLEDLLRLLKLEVEDKSRIENDFASILQMFDHIKDVNIEANDILSKRTIYLDDLRPDEAIKFVGFEPKISGNYYKVPSVTKKN